MKYCFLLQVYINGRVVDAYVDTGATISLVSLKYVDSNELVPINLCGVKTGEGMVTVTEGEVQG